MKKSIIFIAAIIFAICFTACGNSGEKNIQTETTTNGIKLTEQQLEYLKKLRSDITGIEYVSEEDLNRMLLGTGMEIYNPSSGVEVFGLEYNKKNGFDYLAASDSDKKMTLSDVRKFRNKEKEMRIEDLTEYAYTVSEQTLNNSGEKSIIYELDAPITDYENTYMKIWFEIKDDKIKMQVPQLIYKNEADGKTTAFSINYNPMQSAIRTRMRITTYMRSSPPRWPASIRTRFRSRSLRASRRSASTRSSKRPGVRTWLPGLRRRSLWKKGS